MRRGEIWWARPRLAGGSAKRRPFVVVSADGFNENPRYGKVLVVHLTSRQRPGEPYSWEVDLRRGAGGLKYQSIAKCAEVYTVLKDNLDELSGSLRRDEMVQIDRALSVALELG